LQFYLMNMVKMSVGLFTGNLFACAAVEIRMHIAFITAGKTI